MTLFEAKPVDERKERKRRNSILVAIIVILALVFVWWWFRYWPEEHTADKFFQAIEQKNFEQAFAIWNADPDWKQHPEKYSNYTYGAFTLDWGPTGEYGGITSHHVEGAVSPKSHGGSASGVVVKVSINNRPNTNACLWVEKDSQAISFSPIECK
jgi:hypothetical protein